MADKYKHYLLVSSILLFLVSATVIGILLRPPSTSRAFRKFVCDPIPESAKDIKMDRHVGLLGTHTYVFHFRIEKRDLLPILNSRAFQEVPLVKYTGSGQLWWGYPDNQYGLSLYRPTGSTHAPEWFVLHRWDNPKVYVFGEEHIIRNRLLVYSEELAEAYFIDVRSPD